MTQRPAAALTLVKPAPVSSAAARLRANQDAQKAEAKEALADLLARAGEIAAEAKDLSTVEAFSEKQRQLLTALGINTAGSIDAITNLR